MDRKVAVLILVAVLASGCANSTSSSSGGGVKVTEFKIADKTLRPGQQSTIETNIRNSNSAPTQIHSSNISLFNTGQLKVLKKECNPNQISSSEQFNPVIHCTWTVEAPGESFIKGFESKPLPIKMQLRYSSTIENSKALKINFQNLSEIDKSSPITLSTGNGDLSMRIRAESPSSVNKPAPITVKVSNTGVGQIEGSFTVECSPTQLFEKCPVKKDPIQGSAEFTLNAETSVTGTQNIFISTHYKYEKNPNLDIEVVNN